MLSTALAFMHATRPHPGWIVSIAALAALALTLSASYWQFGRADFKKSLSQQYLARQAMAPVDLNLGVPTADQVSYRKVRVAGTYRPDKAIFLDNKLRAGAAGYEIVVPLRIGASKQHVLVNRGWVVRERERHQLPQLDVPAGLVNVSGTAVLPGRGALELSDEVIEGRVWQNLNLARFAEKQGLSIFDFVIQEESNRSDGINRDWAAPGFGVSTHQSYAVQWLLFSALIVFFYVYYGFIRRNKTSAE